MTTPATPQSSTHDQILLKLGEMGIQLAVIQRAVEEKIPDHETRIRTVEQRVPQNLGDRLAALEKWRYGLPVSGLLAVGSIVWTAYQAMHH